MIPKIVRDKIPDQIRSRGGLVVTRSISPDDRYELSIWLEAKLTEEFLEYQRNNDIAELVDIIEACRALWLVGGGMADALDRAVAAKRADSGVFGTTILVDVNAPPRMPAKPSSPSTPPIPGRPRHILKTLLAEFEATWQGEKPYEFRRDDRPGGFQVGDQLCLIEWDESAQRALFRRIEARITYITRGPSFAVPVGYAVLGFAIVARQTIKEGQ